ncbi:MULTISPECIES: hypothetical protein [Pseudomonas]|nr:MULTISPECIES: hypothetical protein [Pseudomonas]
MIGGRRLTGVRRDQAHHWLHLSQEQAYYGADLPMHKIGAVSQD